MKRALIPALTILAVLGGAWPCGSQDQAAERAAMLEEFHTLLHDLETRVIPLERAANIAWWEAATTGRSEAYARQSELQTRLEHVYTDARSFEFLKRVRAAGVVADPWEKRQLERLYLAFLSRQVEPELLKKMIQRSTAIEERFATFRPHVGATEISDNRIEQVLAGSRDRAERKAYWLASKQVGAALAADVVEVVKLRNQAARKLGFRDYYALQLALNEQNERWLLDLFDELDALTAAPFAEAKRTMDEVLAKRLGIKPEEMMPYDYSDRFFQEAPNLTDADLDAPLAGKDLAHLAAEFYRGIGLPVDTILTHSDLFEREGKNPHAFCSDLDRNGDVRALLNIAPNQRWLDTTLHELGHGVYSFYVRRSLPYFLRTDAHIFATEGVAMMFGRLAENASFYRAMGLVDAAGEQRLAAPMREKMRLQALVFSRWCQVMLRFEKELYANPDQDLDELWWQLVKQYQGLKRPDEAPAGAWAAKIHLVTAPVYYHNYELGDLFASQLHATICRELYPGKDPATVVYVGDPRVGAFLKQRVFSAGASLPWPELVRYATGQALSPAAFAAQFVTCTAQ